MKEQPFELSIISAYMKILSIFLLSLLMSIQSVYSNGLDVQLTKHYVQHKTTINKTVVDDYTFVRRVYLDIGGRIPTLEEIKTYVSSREPDKKSKLIDNLLYSEDYVNNFYNYWADTLRIRPDRLSDDVALLKSYPYMEVVRNNIRSDKPLNVWVKEMLTAQGTIMDNGNSGYLLRDTGMLLDNLATTVELFMGKNLSCAQCHDDPFQDYTQLQFYQMASFFGGVESRQARKNYNEVLTRVDEEIKKITGKDRIDNNIRQLLSANMFSIQDNNAKKLRLPFDYKYDNAKPNQEIAPVSLDGKIQKVKESPRNDFASWLIAQPEFTYAYVNRIWNELVGIPLAKPMDNFDIHMSENGEVIAYLGKRFQDYNYSTKALVKEITMSDFYSRPAYTGADDKYALQSILVKRLTSYQMWDSLLSLILDDPNYTRVSFQDYSKLVTVDWTDVTGQKLLDQMESIRQYDQKLQQNILKYKGIDLVRSCFLLNRNNFVGNFLKEFGSSDRILIDATNDKGSITQILVLMNSPLLDVIAENKSQIINAWQKHNKDKNILFLSIMGRPYSIMEKSVVERTEVRDLVWALINTREFMFRK